MPTFTVKIIRESGPDPITGKYLDSAQEDLTIEADNEFEAYKKSNILCSLPFYGQIRKTLIDGKEYLNPRF